jgi:hypothetical protein
MITDHLRAVLERAGQELSPEAQDALAHVIEDLLPTVTRTAPPLPDELRRVFEQALADHAETLAYLRDR